MAIDPATAYLIGQGATTLAGLLKGDPFKRLRKASQEKLFQDIIPGLESGISKAEISQLGPLTARGSLPALNAALSRGSAKFGSRSGLAQGAGVAQIANSVAPQITEAHLGRLDNRQRNLRALLNVLGGLSTKQAA